MNNDALGQADAVAAAEELLRFVAQAYSSQPAPSDSAPKPNPNPIVKTSSFLASACSFQRIAAATPIRTREAELEDEINAYLAFEEVPVIGETGAELEQRVNAQLMNPLGWWKVSNLLVTVSSSVS